MNLLISNLLKYKDSNLTAINYKNQSITYKKFFINVGKMVNYLKSTGIKSGDVVTIVLPNLPTTVYLWYALDYIGAISNIVHPLSPIETILKYMEEAKSKKAFVLETLYKDNETYFKTSKYSFYFLNPLSDEGCVKSKIFYLKYKKHCKTSLLFSLDEYKKEQSCEILDSNLPVSDCVYLHSGGTTGNSKTIRLSANAFNNLASKTEYIVNEKIEGYNMLAVLPIFHGFGLGMGVHSPLSNGCAITLMVKFDPKETIKLINKNKVNYIIGVPALYKKLMDNKDFKNAKLNNLKACFIGGDDINEGFIKEFNDFMKNHNSDARMYEGYGLTETVTVATVNTKKNYKLGSVGKALIGNKILVLDENKQKIPANQIGEVYISGNTLMNGYLNDEEETNKTLITINKEQWVKTGDLGLLDEEGFLFLKGRLKRVVKIAGYNVFPSDIEKEVIESFDEDVKNVAVAKFEKPRTHISLFVTKHPESNLETEDLISKIKLRLEQKFIKYSVPSKIIVIDDMPYTNVGKIDYKKLKEI